jgi:hypothetical protein
MRVPSRSRLSLGLVLVATLLSQAAQAVTRTWTGGGADDNWTTAANWGGTAPSAGDDLVFPGGTPRLTPNNDFAVNTSFNSIAFNGGSGGYTLSGTPILLVAGISAANTAGNNTVQLPITLTASQTFSCTIPGPSDRLTLSGQVDLGAFTLTLDSAGGSIINVNGVISSTGGVTSSGGGVVFIVANCTYTGPTNISAGDFVLAGSSLSPSSAVTVTGGLLQFANGASTGPVTATGGTVGCEGGGTSQIGNVTDLTMQPGSTLFMAMVSVTNFGQLNASGTVNIGGATLVLAWGFTSSTGNTFTIINKTSGGAVTGTFAGLAEGATFVSNGRTYQITYVGGDGNDVVVTDITQGGPTPTPTTTPTVTPTPPPNVTPSPTPTPGPGPTADVPTLSTELLALFGLALALVAIFVIRRNG